MYASTELRKGTKVEIDGEPYLVAESQFVKPGKGNAFTRCRLKSLVSGNVIDRTYKSGERIKKAEMEDVKMQFLYADGDQYHFMNTATYDQIAIAKENLGDAALYLLEQMEVDVLFYNGRPISIEVPNFVILEITHADPGVKGNTATGATKLATLETGAVVQVPLFVEQGEKVKVDTRTGEYVERAK
ncbi:MAG: elongation factor P [Nitrospirae bacterium CG18_big_fil_WC_8_21_14_2_50_70_55]|nr:elongation factor P [Deltaproteobacteria bacterium]OIP65958.1 MAG: elongation factor P [Nitrospirae bacterium CG2_30_70_394]PIQ06768.1 MAG: elongation factor P [Nitrospirae bacterium CG18_big_fil_WC_8_21_14_2_50_70_55]PIU80017.1 MAG: elongation factor P [Nitrospirae bacterium CG06_land_8_20_14_3_00_70_43]PIW83265.1 MAG: elongation factor P [Nitrospirae bacterium CG_4_8_14_3_um_filter_70_85]PIX82578.1 MAG: elongation factor P [Nitrospirae bacterium CG_4_10_14_3_um_filter_70_108]PJB94892.1 M